MFTREQLDVLLPFVKSYKDLQNEIENTRRGLFSRFNVLEKNILSLEVELKKIKNDGS